MTKISKAKWIRNHAHEKTREQMAHELGESLSFVNICIEAFENNFWKQNRAQFSSTSFFSSEEVDWIKENYNRFDGSLSGAKTYRVFSEEFDKEITERTFLRYLRFFRKGKIVRLKCDDCGAVFYAKNGRYRVEECLKCGGGMRILDCPECGFAADNANELASHMHDKHNWSDPVLKKCEYCGDKFYSAITNNQRFCSQDCAQNALFEG